MLIQYARGKENFMSKKVTAKKALKFFEDNFCMIASLEAKGEEGCAGKCLRMLETYVREKTQGISERTQMMEADCYEKS